LLVTAGRVVATREELQSGVRVVECRPPAAGVVPGGLVIEEQEAGQHRVREASVQRDALEEHVAAAIRQVLLKVAAAAVAEVDRLDRDRQQQP